MSEKNVYVEGLGSSLKLFKNADDSYRLAVESIKSDASKPITALQTIGNQSESTSSEYEVLGNKTLVIDVPKMGLSDIYVEGLTIEGTNSWRTLDVMNLSTGFKSKSIVHPSAYIADLLGWSKVRLRQVSVEPQPTTAIIKFNENAIQDFASEREPEPRYKPSGEYGLVTRNKTSMNPNVTSMGKDGSFYGGDEGGNVWKTVDLGKVWTLVHKFDTAVHGWPTNVIKLENGAILATLYNSKKIDAATTTFHLSDENEANFTKVHEFETHIAYPTNLFGTRAYKNIIVSAEYGSKTAPNNARRAYASTNYGKTWKKIYEGEQATGAHVHDVCYDPYDNVIWLVQGDDYAYHKIIWSDDLGETWNSVYEGSGKVPFQSTQIIPLPECVLFTSDNNRPGVMRWKRDRGGIKNAGELILEDALVISKDYKELAIEPLIGSKAAIFYDGEAAAYFGFTQTVEQVTMPGIVFGTKNGFDFYRIWVDEGMPTPIAGQAGVHSVIGGYGKDMLVTYHHRGDPADRSRQILHLKAPDWVK